MNGRELAARFRALLGFWLMVVLLAVVTLLLRFDAAAWLPEGGGVRQWHVRSPDTLLGLLAFLVTIGVGVQFRRLRGSALSILTWLMYLAGIGLFLAFSTAVGLALIVCGHSIAKLREVPGGC